jgi:PAS domain S-box-containing protein
MYRNARIAMKASLEESPDAAKTVESLHVELQRCRRELDEAQKRLEQMGHTEALLAGENRLLEMIAGGDSLPSVLGSLCRLVEELSSGCLCSILLMDPKGDRLWHGAAPSLPASYTKAIDGGKIGPLTGPCGRAAFLGQPVIVSDATSDPLGFAYREVALAHGLLACWSAPIMSSAGRVLGTFAIYWRQPGSPTPQHLKIIGQITHLAAVAIELKRAEGELRRGAAYLAEAQRLSRTGSFGWNVSSGEIFWSKETFCIMGYDPATKPTLELVFDRVHPEDIAMVRQKISDASRDEIDFDFEHRLLMPDGAVKHLRVVARPTKTESGVVEFVGAVMEVTERKQSQDTIRAAKARYEGILAIADDAIISVDSRERIVLFNQGAEKVFGYTEAELIGQPLDILIPRRFARDHHHHLQEFGQSPEVARVMGQRREVFGIRKDGREFPAEASISKLDLGGELVFTVILRDITERKQAAEALRASERLACGQVDALTRTLDALAMESAPDRLVEHVLRTITEQLNAHSTSVWKRDEASGLVQFEFAYEGGELLTKSDARIASMTPSLPVEEIWPWPEIFRTGQPSLLEDIRLGLAFPWREHLLAQGIVSILLVPMLIAGHVDGVIGIRFTRKRAFRPEEMELAQALAHQARLAMQLTCLSVQSRQSAVTAERNRLARDVHDTLAQGFTGVIVQLEAAADATSKGLARETGDHLNRAGELARESLREARRSVQALRPQALEEKSWVEALENLMKKMTANTSMRSEFVLLGQPLPLPADWEENLLRIGQEVLTNALRHAHATAFKTKLVFAPNVVRLESSDNGRGFDPEGKHEGFGLLGMRERVENMGGSIAIESEKGASSTILITLPLPRNLATSQL